MISFEEALAKVQSHRWQSAAESVPLEQSSGRRLAAPISAEFDAPPYTNSAMDGFAVGSLEGPWKIVGGVPAGHVGPSIGPGQAVRINTGSLVSPGTCAVIPKEDVVVQEDELRGEPPRSGAHIREQGEEYRAGSLLAPAGTRITPPLMSGLAAQGIQQVSVDSMPRVALLSTGSELLTPGEPYIPGRVYDSNSVGIAAILRLSGCSVTRLTVSDEADATSEAIQKLVPDHDLLITIGGLSVGDFDFVRPSVVKHGFEIQFSGVAMKPGKPVSFGIRDDGKVWFGLPGNAMSAMITFCLFVQDYLGEPMVFHPVSIQEDYSRKAGREEFVPAQLPLNSMKLVLNPTVGSHSTSGLACAAGLARIPGDATSIRSGDLLDYAALPWSTST